ncbi:unnamed protein product [Victoria cruziana]
MGVFVLLVLALCSACVAVEGATWCVAKSNVGDQALQKALDYACGAGADCLPIQQNGACYSPNTVSGHASYAMNSYFQKKGQVQGSCDFSGSATTTTTDPSYGSCAYPSTASSGTTPTSSSTPSTTPSTTPTTTLSPPSSATPSTTIGGVTPGPTSFGLDNSRGLGDGDALSLGLLLLFQALLALIFLPL